MNKGKKKNIIPVANHFDIWEFDWQLNNHCENVYGMLGKEPTLCCCHFDHIQRIVHTEDIAILCQYYQLLPHKMDGTFHNIRYNE